MSTEYCVPCQDAHQMTDSCLQDVKCKMCGRKGHLRIACPGQEEQMLKEQPTSKQSQEYFEEEMVDIDRIFGPEDKDLVRCGMKRKSSARDIILSNKIVYPDMLRNCEAVEKIGTSEVGDSLMTYKMIKRTPCANSSIIHMESFVGIKEQIRDSCTSIYSEDDCRKNVGDSCNSDSNRNAICISDDKEVHIKPKNNAEGEYTVLIEQSTSGYPQDGKSEISEKIEKDSQSFKPAEILKLKPENCSKYTQLQEPKNQDKKSPMLKGCTYHVVSIHIELFRSNKSPSTKLTQIGCVVSDSNPTPRSFFRAIKPHGLEKYLDNYRIGGDLLQALHMTREGDGTFQFRSRFEMVENDQKIVCVEECEALKGFLDFLENFPNCVLLGVDEDSVSILVKKLKEVNKLKFRELVSGFTYWKRVLKYLDIDGYRTIDLEEYYTKMMNEDLPSFTTASDIAEVLLKTAMGVKSKNNKTTLFCKLCKRIELLENSVMVEYDRMAAVESVEVYSSFRPTVSATFSAEKLEQVTVSSDSDLESEEVERNCPEIDKEVLYHILYNSAALSNKAVGGCITKSVGNCGGVLNGSSQGEYWEEDMARHATEKSSQTVTPTVLKFWQLGKPTKNEGTVICPHSSKCGSLVKYSNIHNHLMKAHKGLGDVLHCGLCRIAVAPSLVRKHMSKCGRAREAAQRAKAQDQALARARDVWLGKKSSVPFNPQKDLNYNYVDKSIGQSVQKTMPQLNSIENYLKRHFTRGGSEDTICCLWMYNDYDKKKIEVLSPVQFILGVKEVALAHWKIDVGPRDSKKKGWVPRRHIAGFTFKGLCPLFSL